MIIQLNPPIPVTTPKGRGLAHFLIDSGVEHNLLWTVFIDSTGECWTYPNPMIRAQKNITMGRENITPFYDPDDVSFTLCCTYCRKPFSSLHNLGNSFACSNCLVILKEREDNEKDKQAKKDETDGNIIQMRDDEWLDSEGRCKACNNTGKLHKPAIYCICKIGRILKDHEMNLKDE